MGENVSRPHAIDRNLRVQRVAFRILQPDWSCRVSFANLNDGAYEDIGRAIRAVARSYWQAYRISKGLPPPAPGERIVPATA